MAFNKLKKCTASALAASLIFSSATPTVFAMESGTSVLEEVPKIQLTAQQLQQLIQQGSSNNVFGELPEYKSTEGKSFKEYYFDPINRKVKSYWFGANCGNIGKFLTLAGIAAAGTVSWLYNSAKNLRDLSSLFTFDIPWFIDKVKSALKAKELKERSNIKVNSKNVIKKLDEAFKKVKGQEVAKERLKRIVVGILDRREQAELNSKMLKRTEIILLRGASGTGKSLLLKCLEEVLMGEGNDAYCLDGSSVDTSSSQSLIDQLFSPVDMSSYGSFFGSDSGSGSSAKQKPSLVKHLEANSNTLLKVEEYDKWGTKDSDEMFRTMHDLGKIHSRGQDIDTSKLIVVMTSNEGDSQDTTGSRTKKKRDVSFMNRVNVIDFDNLNESDYTEIASEQFASIHDYYKNTYEIDVLGVDVAENIAKRAANLNQGARVIETMLDSLRTDLVMKWMEYQESGEYAGKSFYVAFDHIKNEFFIRETEEEIKTIAETIKESSQAKEESDSEKSQTKEEPEDTSKEKEKEKEKETDTPEEPGEMFDISDLWADLN